MTGSQRGVLTGYSSWTRFLLIYRIIRQVRGWSKLLCIQLFVDVLLVLLSCLLGLLSGRRRGILASFDTSTLQLLRTAK